MWVCLCVWLFVVVCVYVYAVCVRVCGTWCLCVVRCVCVCVCLSGVCVRELRCLCGLCGVDALCRCVVCCVSVCMCSVRVFVLCACACACACAKLRVYVGCCAPLGRLVSIRLRYVVIVVQFLSGKSTLFKQMISLYGSGFSHEDLVGYTHIVYNNTLTAMKTLIEESENFVVSHVDIWLQVKKAVL